VVRVIGWASPEWAMTLVLYLTFRSGTPTASLAAFLLGCFQDALTVSPEGLESLALIIVIIIVSFCSEFMKVSNFFLVFLVALASLIKNTLFIPGFLSIMGLYQGVSALIFFECLVKAFITGLVAIPVLGLLDVLVKPNEVQT
jgi:rod shape-determining protein MreD